MVPCGTEDERLQDAFRQEWCAKDVCLSPNPPSHIAPDCVALQSFGKRLHSRPPGTHTVSSIMTNPTRWAPVECDTHYPVICDTASPVRHQWLPSRTAGAFQVPTPPPTVQRHMNCACPISIDTPHTRLG